MAANLLLRDFDPTFEQARRLELQPVDALPSELREILLRSLTAPWHGLVGDGSGANDRWFWILRDGVLDDGQAGRVLLHEIAGRLRVTNTVGASPGSALSSTERTRLIDRFRDEVVTPLADAGQVRVHETSSVGTLTDWVDEGAIEALAQFCLAASGSEGADDDDLWNRFLVRALPVRDGTGFAEALGIVLRRNGWPESVADDLAIQAEQANSLLSVYRAAHG